MSDDDLRCTFVTDPSLDQQCGGLSNLWRVRRFVIPDHLLGEMPDRVVAEPLIRCSTHLAATVDALARDWRLLDGVEKVEP